MACPEPGAITVLRLVHRPPANGLAPGIANAGASQCASN
jgi:hypothetical protein